MGYYYIYRKLFWLSTGKCHVTGQSLITSDKYPRTHGRRSNAGGGGVLLKLQIVRRIIGLVIRVVISATNQNIGENANGLVATVSSLASDWVI